MNIRGLLRLIVFVLVFTLASIIVLYAADTPVKPGIIGMYRKPDFVDVYYQSDPILANLNVGEVEMLDGGPKGFLIGVEAGRNLLVCESGRYRALVDVVHPALKELRIGSVSNMFGPKGLWMEVEDDKGVVYTSLLAPEKSRQNSWRAGIYYYDAHLLDFQLGSADGKRAPIQGELVFNCFPDKMNIQAIFHVTGAFSVKRAEPICDVTGLQMSQKEALVMSRGDAVLGIAGGKHSGNTVRAVSHPLTWKLDKDHVWYDDRFEIHMALFPGQKSNEAAIKDAVVAELNPLSGENFNLKYATFDGYDAGRGLYLIHGIPMSGAHNFYENPRMYLTAEIEVIKNSLPRCVYFMHDSNAGAIQAAVLTDLHGFPLSLPIEVCKSWGGEMEEPVDPGFHESYFPLELNPNEKKHFRSLHLHKNWGDHNLRQVSSIRFYQIYYHLSQGLTETTCFTLPTKFSTIPTQELRCYNTCDVRPLSGKDSLYRPQHQHVALQGWLQYLDQNKCWQWPRYRGSTILSVGPNLAWLIMDYESSDGKVDETIETFEMPHEDEPRTFVRLRYDFKEDIIIGGDPLHNLRLLTCGSYIRHVNWKELAWIDESGDMQKRPIINDSTWSAEGIPIRSVNSFLAAYPHIDGNYAIVVRSFKGMVKGRPFNKLGFSAIGYEDNETELMLVPLIEGNTIDAGSWIELDCMLLPYGDDSSNHFVPYEESIRFGLNDREISEFLTVEQIKEMNMTVMGPHIEVAHGRRLIDLPPTIQTEDNWAEFTFKGVHDRNSFVVTGFKATKLPMLWHGSAFVDQQCLGGDGYQPFENSDGTYGFVFTHPTRTTRRSYVFIADGKGVWRTEQHHYYVTQAISDADIVAVNSRYVDEVELTIEGDGETVIDSPRIWCPSTNYLESSRPINQARTRSGKVRTILVGLEGSYSYAELTVKNYSSDDFSMNIFADKDVTILCDGMTPGSYYEVKINGRKQEGEVLDV